MFNWEFLLRSFFVLCFGPFPTPRGGPRERPGGSSLQVGFKKPGIFAFSLGWFKFFSPRRLFFPRGWGFQFFSWVPLSFPFDSLLGPRVCFPFVRPALQNFPRGNFQPWDLSEFSFSFALWDNFGMGHFRQGSGLNCLARFQNFQGDAYWGDLGGIGRHFHFSARGVVSPGISIFRRPRFGTTDVLFTAGGGATHFLSFLAQAATLVPIFCFSCVILAWFFVWIFSRGGCGSVSGCLGPFHYLFILCWKLLGEFSTKVLGPWPGRVSPGAAQTYGKTGNIHRTHKKRGGKNGRFHPFRFPVFARIGKDFCTFFLVFAFHFIFPGFFFVACWPGFRPRRVTFGPFSEPKPGFRSRFPTTFIFVSILPPGLSISSFSGALQPWLLSFRGLCRPSIGAGGGGQRFFPVGPGCLGFHFSFALVSGCAVVSAPGREGKKGGAVGPPVFPGAPFFFFPAVSGDDIF